MRNKILSVVKKAVLSVEPSAEIILFGSRAREDYRENSDWDFLVLVDGIVDVVRTDRVRRALFEVELETDQIVSSIVRSRQEWNSRRYSVVPLHKNVEREGVRL